MDFLIENGEFGAGRSWVISSYGCKLHFPNFCLANHEFDVDGRRNDRDKVDGHYKDAGPNLFCFFSFGLSCIA